MKKISLLKNKIMYLFILGVLFLPSSFLYADQSDLVTLNNPITGVDTLTEFINKILDVVITIATPIAVLAIIYSGFLFVKARGSDTKLVEAKKTLGWILVGVMVLLGAQLLSSVIEGTITSLGAGT